jgi:FixJ family two-component response regulator
LNQQPDTQGAEILNPKNALAPEYGKVPMCEDTPVVFVVDDDISVRESLELLIRFAGWHPRLFESAQDFLNAPRPLVPSCLVLDINLPDLNGLDLQTTIAGDKRNMPIIFITGYGDIPLTVRALKAGAVEFLTKPFNDDVLLEAMADALQSSRAALDAEKNLRTLLEAYRTLTPREQEIMASVVSGRLNKIIAADLNISEITVKAHRGKVMRKMKARSLADLVKMSALITPVN